MRRWDVLIETPRLCLREMAHGDLPALEAILMDAETMWAYEGPFSKDEIEVGLDRQIASYHSNGFGLWAVVLRETGQMIGQCGITWQDIDGQRLREIGYRFNKAFWHHGYATEAAIACRDFAFGPLGLDEVYSQVRDLNIASMNVAIRMGMTVRSRFVKHYRGVEMPHYAFSVRRTDL